MTKASSEHVSIKFYKIHMKIYYIYFLYMIYRGRAKSWYAGITGVRKSIWFLYTITDKMLKTFLFFM